VQQSLNKRRKRSWSKKLSTGLEANLSPACLCKISTCTI
jgi:hypothetical protein